MERAGLEEWKAFLCLKVLQALQYPTKIHSSLDEGDRESQEEDEADSDGGHVEEQVNQFFAELDIGQDKQKRRLMGEGTRVCE